MAKKICLNCGKELGAFTGKVNVSEWYSVFELSRCGWNKSA